MREGIVLPSRQALRKADGLRSRGETMRTAPRRLLIPVAALAALAIVASGCGSSKKSTSKPASSGAKAGAVTISESEYKLNPANPKVASAGAVRFQLQNKGTVTHAFEVKGPKGEARTKAIQPGS